MVLQYSRFQFKIENWISITTPIFFKTFKIFSIFKYQSLKFVPECEAYCSWKLTKSLTCFLISVDSWNFSRLFQPSAKLYTHINYIYNDKLLCFKSSNGISLASIWEYSLKIANCWSKQMWIITAHNLLSESPIIYLRCFPIQGNQM